ncbi:hypothetical protein ABW19_dt0204978 [Dactylella cylindrospora]|nr:hypothetical protein ABW19_dt0204978 [Dactylella cylindrospora]
MQDDIPQLPRRDLLIPKAAVNNGSLFDTSDDDGVFTPGPEYSSAATSMATINKKPLFQLSRPTTPKSPNMTNGNILPSVPTTPTPLDKEREKRKRRDSTPLDDVQIQVQAEHKDRDRFLDRRTKSPSPGILRPIIKKSPKRTNVRFSDIRSPSPVVGSVLGHKRKISVDTTAQHNGVPNGTIAEESDDTLEGEKQAAAAAEQSTEPPKTKKRKIPTSNFSMGKMPSILKYGAVGILVALAFKLLPSESITPSNLTAICNMHSIQGLAESLPFCPQSQAAHGQFKYGKGDQAPPDYKRLMELQFSFEKVLEDSVGGSRLAYDMKTSEMAVRDLTTLVRVSGLACREQLVVHLEQFGDSARIAARGLSRFSSRVMGTIDSILALDEWAKKTLEDVRDREVAARGSIASLVNWGDGDKKLRQSVSTVFLKTTEGMDGQLQRLAMEAEGVLSILDQLEERLTTIHEIVSREINHVNMENDEVLSAILTKLGANRQKLARNKEHVKLLNNVGHYRKTALSHVSATVVELERMSADLEQLRETVAAPSLLEGVVEAPIELHIRNIDHGIMRLTAGRLKASSRKEEYGFPRIG